MNNRPFRAGSTPTTSEMIRTLAGHVSPSLRWVLTNLWITRPLVRLDILHANEPSPVSPTSEAAWQVLRSAIEQTYPGTIVTPYVMMAASDSPCCAAWGSTRGCSAGSAVSRPGVPGHACGVGRA